MNPNREEEERQDELAWARLKSARKKKAKLQIAKKAPIREQDICDVLDEYDFEALHSRIMKAIDKLPKL